MSAYKSDFLRALAERGFIHQVSDADGLDAAATAGRITAYVGFDATAPSLHIGNLLTIMMLRWLQNTGHRPIALIGGGTSKIGDPSGKDSSRALLTGAHLYLLNLAPAPYDIKLFAQRELLAGSRGSLRVVVLDRNTQAPLAGVPVDVQIRGKQPGQVVKVERFTTDAAGTGQPTFAAPEWDNGSYELCIVAHTPGETVDLKQPVTLKRSWKLMLSSDKPVYQPGQEIHLRALALRRPDLTPADGKPAVFTISDPKGNVIFKKEEPTSRFGIASADCPLAQEILEGPYAVACKVGDVGSRLTVEVQKYVLPKFNVGVQLRTRFGLDLEVFGHYASQQIWLEQVYDTQRGVRYAAFPLNDYFVLNARIGYRLLRDRLDLGVVGTNLLDWNPGRGHQEHPFGAPLSARVMFTAWLPVSASDPVDFTVMPSPVASAEVAKKAAMLFAGSAAPLASLAASRASVPSRLVVTPISESEAKPPAGCIEFSTPRSRDWMPESAVSPVRIEAFLLAASYAERSRISLAVSSQSPRATSQARCRFRGSRSSQAFASRSSR